MAVVKPASHSPQARADIEGTIDYYAVEAPHMVDRFIDALEKATTHIQRAPGTGSPRYAVELNLPGLRFWALNKFPFSLFYTEHEDHLWVIRLVHMSRDIPGSLQEKPLSAGKI
jgi:toxin ParE1/3/4